MKFLREDLPVMGVDLIISSVKLALEVRDRASRLIADGTIPAPGFIVDRARERIGSREDFCRVAEPEHGRDKPGQAEKAREERLEEKKEPPARPRKAQAKRRTSTGSAKKRKASPRKTGIRQTGGEEEK